MTEPDPILSKPRTEAMMGTRPVCTCANCGDEGTLAHTLVWKGDHFEGLCQFCSMGMSDNAAVGRLVKLKDPELYRSYFEQFIEPWPPRRRRADDRHSAEVGLWGLRDIRPQIWMDYLVQRKDRLLLS